MRPPAGSGGSAGLRRRLRAALVQLLCALAGLVLVLLLPPDHLRLHRGQQGRDLRRNTVFTVF
jgi:hypothetical protein